MNTATPSIDLKRHALELASRHPGPIADIVDRAGKYAAFLSGETSTKVNGAATATNGAAKAADKPATAATPKQATATKADTAATPGAAPKAKPGPKPGAKAAADAGKGKPTATVPGDTKAPGGKNTYQDVVNALCAVREKISKDEALKILAEDGGAVKSVRDLKPELFDSVVEGCNNALSGEGGEEAASDPADEFDDGIGGGEATDASDIS